MDWTVENSISKIEWKSIKKNDKDVLHNYNLLQKNSLWPISVLNSIKKIKTT